MKLEKLRRTKKEPTGVSTGCPIYPDVMQAEVAFVLVFALVPREPDAIDRAIADAIDAVTEV